jgi:hypothetical protein
LFRLILILAIIAFGLRWPVLTFPFELNPDETMMAAQAITLVHSPVFYDRVDGTTGGPLLSYALVVPALFGWPITFFSGRLIGLSLFLLGSVAVAALLHCAERQEARRGWVAASVTLLATLAYAFAGTGDFGSYHSELVPACLAAWAEALMLAPLVMPIQRPAALFFLVGFLCGAIPFAKLQAVPIGLTIAGLCYGLIWLSKAGGLKSRLRLSLCLTAGGLLIPVAFLSLFAASGVWHRFLLLGIGNNWAYAGQSGGVVAGLTKLLTADTTAREIGVECLIGTMAAVGSGILVWVGRRDGFRSVSALGCSFLVLVSAFLSVAMPGRALAHYSMLALFPACLSGGLGLLILRKNVPRMAATVGMAAGLLLAITVYLGRPLSLQILQQGSGGPSVEETFPAVRQLRALQAAEDKLICWGWQPSYHLYTQLPQGWPGANYVFLDHPELIPADWRKFIAFGVSSDSATCRMAMEAFRQTLPKFVLDVTGPMSVVFRDRQIFGIHACREFAAVIESHYDLVQSSGVDQLYVRKNTNRSPSHINP